MHPRDKYITVFGFKPVLEALEDEALSIEKLLLAQNLKGDTVKQVERLARQRGILVQRVPAAEVSRLSKHPKEDQGLAMDILAPRMRAASAYFEEAAALPSAMLLALDGVTTPGNVGLAIRTATGLGVDGLILPRKGTAKLSPLVIKASAGVVFKAPLLKCEQLAEVLPLAKKAGFRIYGMDAQKGQNLFKVEFAPKSIFILGNETEGLQQSSQWVDEWLAIPMSAGVESLNVACAASVIAAETLRRRF